MSVSQSESGKFGSINTASSPLSSATSYYSLPKDGSVKRDETSFRLVALVKQPFSVSAPDSLNAPLIDQEEMPTLVSSSDGHSQRSIHAPDTIYRLEMCQDIMHENRAQSELPTNTIVADFLNSEIQRLSVSQPSLMRHADAIQQTPGDESFRREAQEGSSNLSTTTAGSSTLSDTCGEFTPWSIVRSADLLAASTLPNGHVDYQRLALLMSEQRKMFREKLKLERAKRDALESLLIKMSAPQTQGFTMSSRVKTRKKDRDSSSDDRQAKRSKDQKKAHVRSRFSPPQSSSTQPPASEESSPERLDENFYDSAPVINFAQHADGRKFDPRAHIRNSEISNGSIAAFNVDHSVLPPPLGKAVNANEQSTYAPARFQRLQLVKRQPESWFLSVSNLPGIPGASCHEVQLMANETVPTLQDCLKQRHRAFIDNSQRRQQQILTASNVRKEADRQLREVALRVVQGAEPMPSAAFTEMLSRQHASAFPHDQMIRDTRKKYRTLPEYMEKQLNRKKELERATDRVRAMMFKKRILHRVLHQKQVNV